MGGTLAAPFSAVNARLRAGDEDGHYVFAVAL